MSKDEKRFKRHIDMQKGVRMGLLLFCDLVAVMLSATLSLLVRFDFSFHGIENNYLHSAMSAMPVTIGMMLIVFSFMHLYTSLWDYASVRELFNVIVSCFVVTLLQTIVLVAINPYHVPRSYHFIFLLCFTMLTAVDRFVYRALRLMRGMIGSKKEHVVKNIMIIGGGQAGKMIIDEANRSEYLSVRIRCIIDDNPVKWGSYIRNIPVVGGQEQIEESVNKYEIDQIIIAIPSMKRSEQSKLIKLCQETGCEVKLLPGIYQMVNGEASFSKLRKVEIEDLLGRDPISVDMEEIYGFIQDKVILVTGGGGSIGSELCRQIAGHHPKTLIIFDVYENNAYDIQLELRAKYPELNLVTLIGSVRDSRKMWQVFETYRPQVVYHAAAHKHVPLMEDGPCEAIKNNVIGTYKTAYAAMTHGCERFVLISTDKAVNPTNIMGASKRLCEMVVQAFDAKIKEKKADEIPQLFTHLMADQHNYETANKALKETKTEFVAVRFGNVLGSNGSVIPLFKRQIEKGGPVTVTHPDIIRYFMTIPEAVSLVLQAGTFAQGGEIFVLDMGEPVKIVDLAKNLIRLSGYHEEEIKIEFTGLRPGEKLYEEKLMAEEGLKKTENELIHIGCPIPFEVEEFLRQLSELMEAAYKNKANIREYVASMVSTYQPE